jgi:hypothetical protein
MASALEQALGKLEKADLLSYNWVHTKEEYQPYFDSEKATKFLSSFIPFIKGCKDKPTFRDSIRIELRKTSLEDKKWLFEKLKKQIEHEEKLSSN